VVRHQGASAQRSGDQDRRHDPRGETCVAHVTIKALFHNRITKNPSVLFATL
jgi:hypothetical protein